MYYIGVDLGGTNIAVGIVSESGGLLAKKSVPTLNHRDYTEIVKDMAGACIDVIKEAKLAVTDIHSVGIGSPGLVDPQNGVIAYASNLKFNNTPISDELKKYVDLPVYVENDANCAALGENIAGAAKGARNSVTITLGTGIGSGIIINGKIYNGTFFGAAELGHHCIKFDGEQCACGRRGCWEAYASATALIRDAKRAVENNPNSIIGGLVNNKIEAINAKIPFDAKDQGDETAKELIDNYVRFVSEGIANIAAIFQPDVIVVGGGVSRQGDKLLNPIKECVAKIIFGGVVKTDIVIAALGNDAGIIGAAMLCKQDKL